MNKEKLIRYIEGKSTESELDEIIVWLEASEENRRYFAELKNLWIISGNQFSGKYASEFEKKRKPVSIPTKHSSRRNTHFNLNND